MCVCFVNFFYSLLWLFSPGEIFSVNGLQCITALGQRKTNELISSFGKRVIFLAENTSFNKHIAFNLLTSFFIKLCSELKYCVVATVSA